MGASRIQSYRRRPVILHNCHNGCASQFSGPTLAVQPCNLDDPAQQWNVSVAEPSFFSDSGAGLCVGCSDTMGGSSCANTAEQFKNGSGTGLGMQACLALKWSLMQQNPPEQHWNYTNETQMLMSAGRSSGCLQIAHGVGPQVVKIAASQCNGSLAQRWLRVPIVGNRSVLRSAANSSSCLAAGPVVAGQIDPWCQRTANMWRSSTDTLQTWARVMVELESLVGLGHVSGPGAWGFADCLELGIPGIGISGTLTWEESKSHLALSAVTSQPLFLGNDLRPGYVQQRLVDTLLNEDMLYVDQQWAGFAGDRLWTRAVGQEVWGKPLPGNQVAAVVFNRDGITSGCSVLHSIDAPCTDDPARSSGTQNITVRFDEVFPAKWFGLKHGDVDWHCIVFDIFATPRKGQLLGRYWNTFHAEVLPHGSKFLRISNCTTEHMPFAYV